MSNETKEITRLLNEAYDGREGALDQVADAVYTELNRLALRQARKYERRDPRIVTLEPSALVNEAFMRLIKQRNRYDSRGHFFAIATKVMLRVLTDHARARARLKRGGHVQVVTLGTMGQVVDPDATVDVLEITDALERLETVDAKSAEIAKLRLVWGCTVKECATILETSVRTIEREWNYARRWLAGELRR
jgi:RNA polymerase sigma factor (TIGR02999 family)